MYSFTFKSQVFQIILTYIRRERPNEQYRNTVKDLLNTVSQKDKKPHTGTLGLDDTAILHIKIQITEILLEKKTQYPNTVNPYVALFVESVWGPEQGIDAALQMLLINHRLIYHVALNFCGF